MVCAEILIKRNLIEARILELRLIMYASLFALILLTYTVDFDAPPAVSFVISTTLFVANDSSRDFPAIPSPVLTQNSEE